MNVGVSELCKLNYSHSFVHERTGSAAAILCTLQRGLVHSELNKQLSLGECRGIFYYGRIGFTLCVTNSNIAVN